MRRITRVWLDNDVELPGVEPRQDGTVREPGQPARQDAANPAASGVDSRLPFVSVVIVARAGMPTLVCCLEALAQQTYPVERMEVVVVSAAASASTASAVATLARQRPGLRLHYAPCPPGCSLAVACNIGWRRARGEIIGFTLDVVIPSKEWVMAAASMFGPRMDVVGGTVVVPLPARPASALREAAARVQIPWSGANVFYRRALLTQLQGFDERFATDAASATDLAFAAQCVHAGCGIAERAVVVYTVPAKTWLAQVRGQRMQAEEALLAKKHRALYRQHIRQWPPLEHYLVTGVLLTSLVGLLGNRRTLGLRALVAWVMVTLFSFARAARGTSDDPRDLADLLLSTALAPPAAAGYRLSGALRHRVWFL